MFHGNAGNWYHMLLLFEEKTTERFSSHPSSPVNTPHLWSFCADSGPWSHDLFWGRGSEALITGRLIKVLGVFAIVFGVGFVVRHTVCVFCLFVLCEMLIVLKKTKIDVSIRSVWVDHLIGRHGGQLQHGCPGAPRGDGCWSFRSTLHICQLMAEADRGVESASYFNHTPLWWLQMMRDIELLPAPWLEMIIHLTSFPAKCSLSLTMNWYWLPSSLSFSSSTPCWWLTKGQSSQASEARARPSVAAETLKRRGRDMTGSHGRHGELAARKRKREKDWKIKTETLSDKRKKHPNTRSHCYLFSGKCRQVHTKMSRQSAFSQAVCRHIVWKLKIPLPLHCTNRIASKLKRLKTSWAKTQISRASQLGCRKVRSACDELQGPVKNFDPPGRSDRGL